MVACRPVEGGWIALEGYVPECNLYQGTSGCTTNSVPMVFIVFSSDSWGL